MSWVAMLLARCRCATPSAWPLMTAIHDLHIWQMSTTDTALTCHCLMPGGHPGDEFLLRLTHELQEHFSIGHATI